ncbi:hypothetical protein [Vibrio phage YC]|uniref:Uncharacterized protein n=1 Tax=Vibrio phage YC TaxID=2267403 RepID=A0A384ZRY2_9CAUD|nr:hypothetical protein HWB64_gp021 [Vibrio phage YC]AXC34390.1 hypothetical protein [Vibrio phage YC]
MSKKQLQQTIAAEYKAWSGADPVMVDVVNGQHVVGVQGGLIIVKDDQSLQFSVDMMTSPYIAAQVSAWLSQAFDCTLAEPHCADVKNDGETVFGVDEALDVYLSNRRQETVQIMSEIAAERQAEKMGMAEGDLEVESAKKLELE